MSHFSKKREKGQLACSPQLPLHVYMSSRCNEYFLSTYSTLGNMLHFLQAFSHLFLIKMLGDKHYVHFPHYSNQDKRVGEVPWLLDAAWATEPWFLVYGTLKQVNLYLSTAVTLEIHNAFKFICASASHLHMPLNTPTACLLWESSVSPSVAHNREDSDM